MIERLRSPRTMEMLDSETAAENKEDVKRLAAFSDAVFAIAMTLLVLDLKIPEPERIADSAELRAALAQWSAYGAFILSFFVIAAYWMAHFRAFRWLKRIDSVVLWLNLLILLGVCFLPFTTSVVQRFSDDQTAVSLYAAVLAAVGFVWAALWVHAFRDPTLMDREKVRDPFGVMWRVFAPPIVFTLSIVVAFFSPEWATRMWSLIFPLSFWVVHRPNRYR